jgi:hypothetical protein
MLSGWWKNKTRTLKEVEWKAWTFVPLWCSELLEILVPSNDEGRTRFGNRMERKNWKAGKNFANFDNKVRTLKMRSRGRRGLLCRCGAANCWKFLFRPTMKGGPDSEIGGTEELESGEKLCELRQRLESFNETYALLLLRRVGKWWPLVHLYAGTTLENWKEIVDIFLLDNRLENLKRKRKPG